MIHVQFHCFNSFILFGRVKNNMIHIVGIGRMKVIASFVFLFVK